ncbi:MAG: CcmD family protein [Saprospiraceae bacterium]|jgi:CcmD family protein|nr:CcmD family protein [Saprospiraceae bacterium]HRD79760.1 CcmD family protein [Saprospiraceae bacterium]HRF37655.1 CcmD family protein [Saprospiraceae bacterium]HRJ13432.1 CcmD family protein [Saprospiraceae bacterium]HRK79922.1 CcmD family protein [Saprospiraceae bacterium]
MKKQIALLSYFLIAQILPLAAQSADTDFMRSRGKIFVVVAVIAAVFIGIVLFMVFLERRLTKLENQINEHEPTDRR